MDRANTMTDKEILTDILDSQKSVTSLYNQNANECAGEALRSAMMRILEEEHCLQAQVFDEMQKRGWYQTTPAPQDKIQAARQKFMSPS